MSNQKPILIEVFKDEAIGDVCSTTIELCFDYIWFLQIVKSGADGNPLFTLEASNDGVNWDTWHCDFENVELIDNSVSFHSHYFGAKYLRLCMEANGTTTGTVSALLNLRKP